jgi:hypothetical protein
VSKLERRVRALEAVKEALEERSEPRYTPLERLRFLRGLAEHAQGEVQREDDLERAEALGDFVVGLKAMEERADTAEIEAFLQAARRELDDEPTETN